jgi:hypothetical protein
MLINESAARMLGYASPQEAVGRNFDQWGRHGKIIGVLKDYHYKSLQKKIIVFPGLKHMRITRKELKLPNKKQRTFLKQ